MTQDATSWATVSAAFGIPEFLQPWLDRFFEPEELDLILELASGPLLAVDLSAKGLQRAYKRGIINCCEDDRIELADFHARFEIWAIFEGWKDIPQDIRFRLTEWELEDYEARNRKMLEGLKFGQPLEAGQKDSQYLLLHEAEELLDRAEHIYLWPCNCRAMMGRCPQSLYTCLRFDNDRGLGWEISHQRAKEITRDAHRQGLMQLGEIVVTEGGTREGGLCNCCADCCFPHLLAERLESQKIWPRSRYIAHYDAEQCLSCAVCVKKCPFQAFQWEENNSIQAKGRQILFKPEQCRGCGICASACPADAIEMRNIQA